MTWSQQVLHYCERTGYGFWDEPINALTNGAFVAAALAIFLMLHRRGERDWPVVALATVVMLVGIGSFLFHTFATRWAMLADVLPIAIFIYGYLLLALRRFLGLALWPALALLAAFAAVNVTAQIHGGRALNGSVAYLPALGALIAVAGAIAFSIRRGFGAREPRLRLARGLLGAAILFAVSLVFRTVDRPACDALPLGTHFLWHLLNAMLLYMLLRLALLAQPTARGSASH